MRCWIQQSTKLKLDYFDLMYATCSLGELEGETFADRGKFFYFAVCKSCIVGYLKKEKNCPKCDILIHQSHPLNYIR